MKIIPIQGKNTVYTSNVYLVTGDWKRIGDMNTLIDVGNDPSIIDVIESMNGGAGKKRWTRSFWPTAIMIIPASCR